MNEHEILNRLWDVYGETPFTTFSIKDKLNLCPGEPKQVVDLLREMVSGGSVRYGYRVESPQNSMYQIRKAQRVGENADTDQTTSTNRYTAGKAENDFLYQPPPETPASPAPSNISRPQQPSPATLNPTDPFPAVPQELKEQRQWVNWVETERNGKPTKIPIQLPRHQDGKILAKGAKSETPSTWRTYQQVLQTHNRYKNVTIYTWKRDDTSENPNWVTVHGEYGGIGVVFSPSDPYCGIDFDNCLDSDHNIKAWAEPILERLKPVAYGEVSPSGTGIKFWTLANLPQEVKHKVYIEDLEGVDQTGVARDAYDKKLDAIEIYDHGRYFTVTGHGKGEIGNGQQAVDCLAAEYLTHEQTPPLPRSITTEEDNPTSSTTSSENLTTTDNLSAEDVIAKIRQSPQVYKFDALMAGYQTGYGSHSEADIALCSIICFWTQNTTVIDAIFRKSDLMRPKWDEVHKPPKTTYGQMTIDKALSGKTETYQPRQSTEQRRRSRRYGRRYRGINQ